MRKLFALLLMALALQVQAQPRSTASRNIEYQEYQVNKNYSDSLVAFKEKLDSMQMAEEALEDLGLADGRFYKLFAPLTFYHSPARKALRLVSHSEGTDPVSDEIDNTLLSVYLNRPDLVLNSENRLNKVGGLNHDFSAPIQQDVALVEKVDPVTVEQVEDPPVEVLVTKPNFWTFKGDYFLQGLQSYISGNWYKGGESNYSILGSITMEANYNNKQKVKWDNKLEMKLGFLTSKSDSVHSLKTSDDLLRLTSKLGLQATKKWYYTLQLLAYTQFWRGFKSNDRHVYSDIMSPFNLNISLGMDYNVEAWKKKLTGTIHLAPFAYNFKYVDRNWFGDKENFTTRYGLDLGKHTLHDFGSQFTIDLKWAIAENITYQTRMYGFTTFKRVEWEWENTFTFNFNKYISTKLFIYPRFDDSTMRDDHHGYFQFKEFMSLGFSYSF
ncbi:MAG: DUF3078 domain-containing protein [Prevotella sp.]|nr:DUF3078 domain-containing protein [Prevotella sp.]